MPAYNAAKYIRVAVDSILCQTLANLELVIVDDHSQDETRQIVSEFQDSRIILINNPQNCGAYFSRNVGMLHSHGRYISFVDSDDILSPNRFLRITEFMDSHPDVMYAETAYMRYYPETNTVWNRAWVKGVGTGTIRRAVIDDLGYFLPMRAGADSEYSERIKRQYGPRASCFLRDFTYWAVQRDENLTNQFPIGGDARMELRDFVKTHFHRANELRVAFPFEDKLIEQVRRLKLFSVAAATTIPPPNTPTTSDASRKPPHPLPPSVDLLMKLLALSEQCNSIFYANFLTQVQDNKLVRAALESIKSHRQDDA